MIQLDLSRHRRARVWVGELPDVSAAVDHFISTSVLVGEPTVLTPRAAAVELVVPLGGRTMYGLLGGRLSPSSEGLLRVDVAIADARGSLVSDHLAPREEEVRAGLPAEYGDALLGAIASLPDDIPGFPSGHLILDCAAHGAVSSSRQMFGRLCRILLQVMACEGELTIERCVEFFE